MKLKDEARAHRGCRASEKRNIHLFSPVAHCCRNDEAKNKTLLVTVVKKYSFK
jgi:hypothetical protein